MVTPVRMRVRVSGREAREAREIRGFFNAVGGTSIVRGEPMPVRLGAEGVRKCLAIQVSYKELWQAVSADIEQAHPSSFEPNGAHKTGRESNENCSEIRSVTTYSASKNPESGETSSR